MPERIKIPRSAANGLADRKTGNQDWRTLNASKTSRQSHELDAASAAEVAAGYWKSANLLLLKTIQQIALPMTVCIAQQASKESIPGCLAR
jgi:hypothetical protein